MILYVTEKIVWDNMSLRVWYYMSLPKAVWYSTSLREYETICMKLYALPFSVSSYILVLRMFTSPNPNPIYMVILCFLRHVSLQKLWRGKGSWRNILVGRNLVIAACIGCNTVAKVISSLDANFAAFVMTIVTNYKFTFAGELECCAVH